MLTAAPVPLPIRVTAPAPSLGRARRWTEPMRALLRVSKAHGTWIAVWSVVGWAGTLAMPILADHPFLLMMLSPRALFAAMAADSVNLVPFVLLGTLRLSVTDGSYFIIGRRLPSVFTDAPPMTAPRSRIRARAMLWVRRFDLSCRWLCRRPLLAGAVLFLRPNGKYLAIAGGYKVSGLVAGLSSVLGTMAFLTALHLGLGVVF